MTSANNLGVGKSDTVRRIKIRNLSCMLDEVRLENYTPMKWCREERDWYPGEKEDIIDDLVKTIGVLTDALDS